MMERITTFVYCINTTRIQGDNNQQAINAEGIIASITPEYIPGTFSFSIIFSLLGLQEKAYELTVNFVNPDGQILVDAKGLRIPYDEIYRSEKDTNLLPPEEKGLLMNMDLRNVVFAKEGYYNTIVYCDGVKLGEYSIYAKGKNI